MGKKAIRGITIEIGGDTTPLNKALKGVNSKIRETQSALKDVDKLLKMDPGNTQLLQQKYDLLGRSIDQTRDKLETLKEAEKQAMEQLADGKISQSEFEDLQREIIETEQDLKGLEGEFREFGSVATQQAKLAGEKMKEAGEKITGIGTTMTKTVTAPIMGIGAASIMAFKEVDEGLDTVAQKTGAAGEELEAMQDIAKGIATSLPTDFATAGQAVGEVNTRFGVVGDSLDELSRQFIKFADINEMDVSSSVDSVQKAMKALGVPTKQAGLVLDTLNQVGQRTGVDLGKLTDSLSANAAQLNLLGLNAAEAINFLGDLEVSSMDASKAMVGLNTAAKKAAKEGKSLPEMLKEFQEGLSSAESESEKLTAAIELFGSKAGPQMLEAMENGSLSFDNFGQSIMSAAGNLDQTFSEMHDGLDELTPAMNSLKEAGAEIGEVISDLIPTVITPVVEAIKGLAEWWKSLPEGMQEFIVKAALVVAAVGPVLTVFGGLISALGTVTGALSGVGGLIGRLISSFTGFGGAAGAAASSVGQIGSAAGAAAGPMTSAGGALGTLAQNAIGFIALGAGIALAAGGLALLAQSAIAIAESGWGAAGALAELVAALALLAGGAALIAAPLSAGAVGLVAFGAAVLMVGGGIWLVTDGIAALADKLPLIAEYGNPAAAAIGALSLSILGFSGAATAAGGGALLLGEGLLAIAAGVGALSLLIPTMAIIVPLVMGLGEALVNVGSGIKDAASGITILAGALPSLPQSCTAAVTALGELNTILPSMSKPMMEAGLVAKETATAFAGCTASLVGLAAKALGAGRGFSMMGSGITAIAMMLPFIPKYSEEAAKAIDTLYDGLPAFAQAAKKSGDETKALSSDIEELGAQFAKTADAAERSLLRISDTFTSTFEGIKDYMNGVVAFLKGVFQFEWSLPEIKLPHFSVSGQFSANPPSVPTYDVKWYRKAMDNAYLLNSPTVFGSMGGSLLAGGEAGEEMVIGKDKLMSMISEASGKGISPDDIRQAFASALNGVEMVAPVYIGQDRLDEAVAKVTLRSNYRSGGR